MAQIKNDEKKGLHVTVLCYENVVFKNILPFSVLYFHHSLLHPRASCLKSYERAQLNEEWRAEMDLIVVSTNFPVERHRSLASWMFLQINIATGLTGFASKVLTDEPPVLPPTVWLKLFVLSMPPHVCLSVWRIHLIHGTVSRESNHRLFGLFDLHLSVSSRASR